MPNPSHRQREFRHICGTFATGVMVLLSGGTTPHGMTINAFMSLSLEPLLVAVAVHKGSSLAGHLAHPGTPFSLSVLGSDQEPLARFYSRPARLRGDHSPGAKPVRPDLEPVIARAAAWIWCRTEQAVSSGDHWLLVAQVDDFAASAAISPLIFHQGQFFSGMRPSDESWLDDLLLLER